MKQTIAVVGMACSACSATVERKLNSLDGVTSAVVNLAGRSALIDFDPSRISLETMKREINNIGYDLVIEKDRSEDEIQKRQYVLLRRKTIVSWLISLAVMCISMQWMAVGSRDMANQLCLLLALSALVYCGRQFYVSAWKQLLHGTANMDTLVALSTGISFLFSAFNTFRGDEFWGAHGIAWHTYYDAGVMIITFVLTGRMLEEKAKDGTAAGIRKLMGMTPKTARACNRPIPISHTLSAVEDSPGLSGGDIIGSVPISTIEKGDILEVRAGEKIPVDGVVTWATSFMTADAAYVDESMITGEPTLAEKKAGSQLLAGTIPGQGKLRMRAREIGEDTTLANIIRIVQEAQGSKAPVQRIVDKAALVFVPVVVGIALATFLAWYLIGGTACLPQALLCSVAVLVVACPCAMGLATPTALMVGIGKAAEQNTLIKDATALEHLCKIDALVIDKTGTLTIPNQNIDFTKADNLPPEQRETLKPHAREAMQTLQQNGITVYMMSGDKEEAVRYWANQAGISNYQSRGLPGDKEKLVERLRSDGRHVAMAGDGINDTQALACADVSIAIGKGTDVAMDVAQITLMGDDLRAIPEAISLSRKTVRTIRQNLFWAFIYNIITIPLAAGVPWLFGIHFQITPIWASALMAFSSLSVILNSLRLKYMR